MDWVCVSHGNEVGFSASSHAGEKKVRLNAGESEEERVYVLSHESQLKKSQRRFGSVHLSTRY